MTLLLTNDEVEKALTIEDALEATETIYREIAEGTAINRARSQTYLPAESKENKGFRYRFKSQEGGSQETGVWALRITSDMAGHSFTAGVKRRRILPVATGNSYCGLVFLFDVEKIEPVAIMPDGFIQKMRVAALSSVAAKYLAPENPKALGLFGSGWQAGAHLEFLCNLFPFERIKVYSPNKENRQKFAETMSKSLDRAVEAVDAPREAVAGCDFVQCATAAWDAVLDGSWIEEGSYVASIGGADASNKRRELDDETIRRADLYVVHSKEVARLDESPDVWEVAQKKIKEWEEILEIQDLLVGNVTVRSNPKQIAVFNNNTGAGVQFAAVGSAVLRRAKEMGLGRQIPTEWFLEDVSP